MAPEARDPRVALLDVLRSDLIGPGGGVDEVLDSFPTDRYVLGLLYPEQAAAGSLDLDEAAAEEDDEREGAGDEEGGAGQAIAMTSMRRPTSMGLSFSMEGNSPRLRIAGSAGRYVPVGDSTSEQGKVTRVRWQRHPVDLGIELPVTEGLVPHPGPDGLRWWVRGLRHDSRWQVTVVLSNVRQPAPGRVESEPATFLQTEFRIEAGPGCRLIPRRSIRPGGDDDSAINDLIYRDGLEWAVGHTCGASWATAQAGREQVIATWVPSQHVPSMDAAGHRLFGVESKRVVGSTTGAYDAGALAAASSGPALAKLLGCVPSAYAAWFKDQEAQIANLTAAGKLEPDQVTLAHSNLDQARLLQGRMVAGIALLEKDPIARRAFQLAQRAMVVQRQWTDGSTTGGLSWRPFQLGFQLLALAGLIEPGSAGAPSADRMTMDLLWFPTGGGKTEAYLALTAFTLIHRRLREKNADDGAGVAVLMRYTLRLLTIQQFERASRLVLACELERRKAMAAGDLTLGALPFAIGLWVGSDATPNTVEKAREGTGIRKAQQLARCPACRSSDLDWDAERATRSPRYVVRCDNPGCPLHGDDLPIHTIDEEVYHRRPGLLIGTIDKFAQIVRNPDTHRLFAPGTPPELIIQDELHLISGPLGTVAGLYEAAIDQICTHRGVPPKIIGSTATIRRASNQVRQLFDREVAQFPPPVLDAHDSCFAVVDPDLPGRIYAGVSSTGRSPKFVLQAVCATLMQAASEPILTNAERDAYWTLVAYFNSLRELGGALVMMLDDVSDSVKLYARLHGAPPRTLPEPLELTSRLSSEEIPGVLDQLGVPYPAQEYAAVLATNMISVGVDVPRLGLMVVNGQPKSMSEYIQATSRVGRNQVAGLVVTVYNAGRPRDRSHFEAFRTWHQALYREVEATSVTPFASRARDRALHAALVALARHEVPGMLDTPRLGLKERQALQPFVDRLLKRATDLDQSEIAGVQADVDRFLDGWQRRPDLKKYWNEQAPGTSLLISAERAATLSAVRGEYRGDAKPTPNSMRDVEGGTTFRLINSLASRAPGSVPGTPSPVEDD